MYSSSISSTPVTSYVPETTISQVSDLTTSYTTAYTSPSIPTEHFFTVKDGETVTLQCETGQTIGNVSYGKYQSLDSSCHRIVTVPGAVGKNSYTLGPWLPTQVSPEGDPCPGEPKELNATYSCS
jgi:hypothetical protein